MPHPPRLAAVRHYLKGYEQKQINAFATYVPPLLCPLVSGILYDSSSTQRGANCGKLGGGKRGIAASRIRTTPGSGGIFTLSARRVAEFFALPQTLPTVVSSGGEWFCGPLPCAYMRYTSKLRFSAVKNPDCHYVAKT